MGHDPRLPARATQSARNGRLGARPGEPAPLAEAPATGLQQMRLGNERDVLLFIPTGYEPETPAPFALMLHGAGGTAESGMGLLASLAEEAGLIVLAPSSRTHTSSHRGSRPGG